MIQTTIWLWVGFIVFVIGMLAIDLGVGQRKAHAVSMKEAGIWTAVWISISLAFNLFVWLHWGREPGMQFLTGYLIEKALSVDNLFVFVMIFSVFGVPAKYQHRVLFWGVLGALVMRGAFIAVGTTLLDRFEWLMYVFGAFLVYTGIRLGVGREVEVHPEKNPLARLVSRFIPVTKGFEDGKFMVRRPMDGRLRLMATPLLLVLVIVESTDLLFAIDSIPAVIAVTRDPFLVFTSNVFAILGLRALYFLLAGAMDRFHYLKPALAVILSFVGVKMLLAHFLPIPVGISLGVIGGVLAVAVVASLLRPPAPTAVEGPAPCRPEEEPAG